MSRYTQPEPATQLLLTLMGLQLRPNRHPKYRPSRQPITPNDVVKTFHLKPAKSLAFPRTISAS
jgi:hypothetical protein